MNRITIYLLAFIISFTSFKVYAQQNNRTTIHTNASGDNIFYHTIERGQTVYSIATMYGVTVDDIYSLNPGSRESIKAGDQLRIPQQDVAPSGGIASPQENYTFHTIQPQETLYSLTIKYDVPASVILEANPGLSVATFTIGKTIRIPAMSIQDLPVTEYQTVTKTIEYTVPRRETMYSITRRFNVSSAELLELNPQLKDGVKAGMVLKIPVHSEERVVQTPATPPRERDVNALLSAPKQINRVNMIKVALLLPFMTEEPDPNPTATARFIEYYEGMLLAIDSLRNLGVSIELSVYDTGNGTVRLNRILEQPEVKEANLIIGAVQNEQIGPVSAFAQEHQIKYVIPFTSRNDDVLSNANIFQVNTPQSYLYSKAAQIGCDLFRESNIILLDTEDRENKTEFMDAFKTEMQQRNIPWQELTYQATTFAADLERIFDKDKRNVIVSLSGSLDALNQFRSPLRTFLDTSEEVYTVSLFGYPEWQTYTRECLEDFYALGTYIYSNFYADNMANNLVDFYTKYTTWFSKTLINTFPKYGILGFDTGMYFFTAVHKYGSNFENNLDKINYRSIQTGFDFQRVNNWGGFINTNLFIVHYDKASFTVNRSEFK
ncbi:MAG: LysM peptidoglycan-binding domain-containing protein [Tannerellaceae bacterium]|nr:LysM peptidoglycan-binding domain-containing protein [Tannerellaceae bacterium]